ncbi:MAG: TonB-dependent receptor plug domain-containing protein [Elusimicrobia bacterium]|nr:TonB-dependent receptor plug domain-containing protein [Elusimicrobiota bacterium]
MNFASGALALNLIFQPNGFYEKNPFGLGTLGVPAERSSPARGRSVSLDKESFELREVRDVADALRDVPGASFSVGARNEKQLYLRGFEPRQVAVLYDGIPIYVPYDGYVDLGKLPVANVSGIEVLDGADSVLYGPNSMGGALNIVVREWRKNTFYLLGDTKLAEGASTRARLFFDRYVNIVDAYDDQDYSRQRRNSSFHSTYDDFSFGGSLKADVRRVPKNDLSFSFWPWPRRPGSRP